MEHFLFPLVCTVAFPTKCITTEASRELSPLIFNRLKGIEYRKGNWCLVEGGFCVLKYTHTHRGCKDRWTV